jgi:hypothetical protein
MSSTNDNFIPLKAEDWIYCPECGAKTNFNPPPLNLIFTTNGFILKIDHFKRYPDTFINLRNIVVVAELNDSEKDLHHVVCNVISNKDHKIHNIYVKCYSSDECAIVRNIIVKAHKVMCKCESKQLENGDKAFGKRWNGNMFSEPCYLCARDYEYNCFADDSVEAWPYAVMKLRDIPDSLAKLTR